MGAGGSRLQAELAASTVDAPSQRARPVERLIAALRSRAGQVSLVVGVAFALRLWWVLFTKWRPMGDDAFRYDNLARALADGRGYVHLTGDPTAFWPPGYPLLLATPYTIFGQRVIVGQLMNVALATATVALVYLIGRRLFDHLTALVGAAIVACFPSLIFFTGVTLSETAFTFLALLGVYLLIVEAQGTPRRDLALLLGAGVALGLAALTRGQALVIPLAVILFWWRLGMPRRAVLQRLGIVLLGVALMITPWTIRNIVQLDSPVLISTNAGVDFWIGHHETAKGDFGEKGGDPLVFSHPELTVVQREVHVNNEGFIEGMKFALIHPTREIVLPFKKFFWLYYNDEQGLRWNEGHGDQDFLSPGARSALIGLSNVYYYAVIGLLVIGITRWFSLRDPGRLLLMSLVAYWTLVHAVFFGDVRFHAPIMPLVALLAALAWVNALTGRQADDSA